KEVFFWLKVRTLFKSVTKQGKINKEKLFEIFQGWNAYAKWADSFKLRREVVKKIYASSSSLSINNIYKQL
ncbi:hypothetical protein COV16_00555, partial [Candidatus Woesearchaeota archaeon CG10_big_fil_rev_8_21_14_0_10_34_8]